MFLIHKSIRVMVLVLFFWTQFYFFAILTSAGVVGEISPLVGTSGESWELYFPPGSVFLPSSSGNEVKYYDASGALIVSEDAYVYTHDDDGVTIESYYPMLLPGSYYLTITNSSGVTSRNYSFQISSSSTTPKLKQVIGAGGLVSLGEEFDSYGDRIAFFLTDAIGYGAVNAKAKFGSTEVEAEGVYSFFYSEIPANVTGLVKVSLKINNLETNSLDLNVLNPSSYSIIVPSSGQILETGKTYSISWSGGTAALVSLMKGSQIVTDPVTKKSYELAKSRVNSPLSWTVPSFLTAGSDYRLLVIFASDNSRDIEEVFDDSSIAAYYAHYYVSPHYFSIGIPQTATPPVESLRVISPNGGEVWEKGKTYNITWEMNKTSTVNIYLYKGSVCTENSLNKRTVCGELVMLNTAMGGGVASHTSNSGSYAWTIPDDLAEGKDYRIGILDVNTGALFDQSDASFSIIKIVEQGAVTPRSTVLNTNLSNWNSSYSHPDGTLINQNGTVYKLEKGKKRGFSGIGVFRSYGNTFKEVVPASEGDKLLPDGDLMKYADGDLINDIGTVFQIHNGVKYGFTSKEVFEGLGYRFENVYDGDVGAYPAGEDITSAFQAHPAGTKVFIDGAVYLVGTNSKMLIPSMEVFRARKFRQERIVVGNASDKALPVIGQLDFPEGSLLNIHGTIYYLDQERKRYVFSDAQKFEQMGYKFENAISTDFQQLERWQGSATFEELSTADQIFKRDSRRLADIRLIMTALELFFSDNNRYPTAVSGMPMPHDGSPAFNTYLAQFPFAPTPADGSCSTAQNYYWYTQIAGGESYEITFCLGESSGGYSAGLRKASPVGIQ